MTAIPATASVTATIAATASVTATIAATASVTATATIAAAPTTAPATPSTFAHFGQILQGEPVSLLPERDGLFWCERRACSHCTARPVDGQTDHESESDK